MPYFSVAGIVVGPSLQLLFSIGSSTNNDYYNKIAHFSPHFLFSCASLLFSFYCIQKQKIDNEHVRFGVHSSMGR